MLDRIVPVVAPALAAIYLEPDAAFPTDDVGFSGLGEIGFPVN